MMASVAPLGSVQSQPPPQSDNSSSSTPLSWEGDKMFNIYIYDYCSKRGFRKTARELLAEAEIPPESIPPINARQGLLFEWWSVFWVLFSAKSSGQGSDDALLYTQYQSVQQSQRQLQAQRLQPPHTVSSAPLPLGPQSQPQSLRQPPQAMGLMNGLNRPGPGFMANGPMPNGIVAPPLQGQPPNPPGTSAFPMGAPGPQSNGISGPPGQPITPGTARPPNFNHSLPGQRGPLNSPQQQQMQQPSQQQRAPNVPFQSPVLTHSSQNLSGISSQSHPPQQPPPMAQLGPSPHITPMGRGGMLPPNGPQGMGSMNAGPPTPGYQQGGRPPSRTNTPAQDAINNEILQIPTALVDSLKREIGSPNKDISSLSLEEKQQIIGLHRSRTRTQKPTDNAAAGPSNLHMQPPNQQQRNSQQPQQQQRVKRSSTSPGEEHQNLPRNESSPPDRKRVRRSPMEQPAMTPMNYPQHQQQQQPPGGPQPQPPPNMRPGASMVIMRPPMGSGPLMGNMGGPVGGGPMSVNPMSSLGGGPMNNSMNGGGPHPSGPPPQMGNPMNMGMGQQQPQMGVPQMGNTLNPQLGMPGQQGSGMTQNQLNSREAYRQQLHVMHKQGLNQLPPNAGSPASNDPGFNPGGPQGPQGPQFTTNNRLVQKPGMGMMPPPSPAMNGPPKDQPSGPEKDNKNASNPSNGRLGDSPRNQHPQTPNPGGTNPPTPIPMAQQQQPQNQNPAMSNPNPGQNSMGQSPLSLLGGGGASSLNPPPSMGGPPPTPTVNDMGAGMFGSDFMQSTIEELDAMMFRPDGDINFERDFGQWFSPDDTLL